MPATSVPAHAVSADLQRDAEGLQLALAELVRVYQFRDRDASAATTSRSRSATRSRRWSSTARCAWATWPSGCSSTRARRAGWSRTLVKKGYVEQHADASDGRATAMQRHAHRSRLCARITDDLVDQQKQLLGRISDPDVRAGVVERDPAAGAGGRFAVSRRASLLGVAGAAARRATAGQPAAADFFGSISCYCQS